MAMTPFDTGETAEPVPWMSNKRQHMGKVDFDTDEGALIFTAQVRRTEAGDYALHIWGAESMEVILHESHVWVRHAKPEEEDHGDPQAE